MTGIYSNSIKDQTGTRQLASDSGSAWSWGSALPSGSIVQVQSFQKTDTASMTNIAKDTDYVLQDSSSPATSASTTGILQVNITPQIAGSKIWLQVQWFGEVKTSDVSHNMMFTIYRDTTILKAPQADSRTCGIASMSISYYDTDAGTTPENAFFQYFDTHGISAGTQITYKLGIKQGNAASQEIYTNMTEDDNTGSNNERGVSSICAIELAP
tara:strand:+ start:2684 stop:3322 length:639 start_codon:yes stop_codon:yes gene_type:complete